MKAKKSYKVSIELISHAYVDTVVEAESREEAENMAYDIGYESMIDDWTDQEVAHIVVRPNKKDKEAKKKTAKKK